MTSEKTKKPLPPYVSYRTFQNFLDGLQMGTPARIDRSYWGDRYSGSTGVQLMSALRFLGLVGNDGTPTVRLKQLVLAKGAQRAEVLRQVVSASFGAVMEKSIDPQVATYAQLEEAFYNMYQVSGDVARKCIKFFISLESEAGVPLSPFIVKKSKTARTNTGKKRITAKSGNGTNRNVLVPAVESEIPVQATWHEMVLSKFPTFDPAWTDDVKLKWFEAFNALLKKTLATDGRK